ncbi:MAG TPA: matrixin family metalloprotease [Chloroflexia bacterium]|jgi:hypothetical protein
MEYLKRYRKAFRFATVLLLAAAFFQSISISSAFDVIHHWDGWPANVYYGIESNFDTNLGLPGATDIVAYDIVPKWNKVTWHHLTRYTPWNSNDTGIATWNQPTVTAPGCESIGVLGPDPAITCPEPIYTSAHTKARIYLNTGSYYGFSWTWNNSGIINCSSNPGQIDLKTVTLHEFGHTLSLGHNTNNSAEVMVPDCRVKQVLWMGDRDGAVQIYGPKTSWDWTDGYALGETNIIALRNNVAGYFNSTNPPPELGNRGSEYGVTPVAGSRMELLAGYAQASYSYGYMRLFSFANDNTGPHNEHYLTIDSGTKIRWFQYNYQQSTMSIDFRMSDGTYARDYNNIRDQNNVPLHPAARGNYPTGQWIYFEVDLSPLANKTITEWYIAYDNGNTHTLGQYRSYFENFRIEYP